MSICYIRLLTDDGLKPVDYEADSLAKAAQYEPIDGVYTVTNTYNTFQTLKLDAHLDRLEDSARRASIPLQLNRAHFRHNLRQMIQDVGVGDVRFRVTVGRQQPDVLIISLEPFQPIAQALIDSGVRCMTIPDSARNNPVAKTTDWMHNRSRIALPEEIYDGILLDAEGRLLEGFGSNFYAILNGELRTAGAGVLPGISQQIVFQIAPDIVPVCQEAVTVMDIPVLSEAFITSSSRGIVPIVELDGHILGDGKPGQTTKDLQTAYLQWVVAHLESL